jgi:MSHA biogenesis protein MshP
MSPLRARVPQRPQRGFAIVSAIFLLVVLAALGAFMLTLSSSQQLTSAQDLQGTRTYWAAKAGIQWAADRINVNGVLACAAMPTPFTLDGISVTVACQSNPYTEGTVPKTIYWVESTATSGGAVGGIAYTERVLNAFIEF